MGENGVGTLVCFICDEHGTYCLSTAALHTNSTRGGLFPTQPHKIEEQFKYWDLIYIISLKKKSGLPSAPQTFVNFPSEVKVVQLCLTLWPHGLYSPWISPGQNTGVGSLSRLQIIFPTQGLNSGLPHCRQILYQLRHQGSPEQNWASF